MKTAILLEMLFDYSVMFALLSIGLLNMKVEKTLDGCRLQASLIQVKLRSQ